MDATILRRSTRFFFLQRFHSVFRVARMHAPFLLIIIIIILVRIKSMIDDISLDFFRQVFQVEGFRFTMEELKAGTVIRNGMIGIRAVEEKFASEDSLTTSYMNRDQRFLGRSRERNGGGRGIMRRRCPRAKQSEILPDVCHQFAHIFVQIPGERHGYRSCRRVVEWDPLRRVERERGGGRGGGDGG